MGGGSWTNSSYSDYISTSRGTTVDNFSKSKYTVQEVYKSRRLDPMLDPKNVIRQCHDSEEHPESLPVILALDVTGSMGSASMRVAQKLNEIMTSIYDNKSVKDVEFCVMGIGDLVYDDSPIQISQFESDVRIAEQLDKLYFEGGGGGNTYESYTAAWYMGTYRSDLHCWKRGKKGIIITLGDECPNPYLPARELKCCLGDIKTQGDIETKALLEEAREKFDIYHIAVDDYDSSYRYHNNSHNLDEKWKELLGEENFFVSNLDNLAATITNIIINREEENVVSGAAPFTLNENNEIVW